MHTSLAAEVQALGQQRDPRKQGSEVRRVAGKSAVTAHHPFQPGPPAALAGRCQPGAVAGGPACRGQRIRFPDREAAACVFPEGGRPSPQGSISPETPPPSPPRGAGVWVGVLTTYPAVAQVGDVEDVVHSQNAGGSGAVFPGGLPGERQQRGHPPCGTRGRACRETQQGLILGRGRAPDTRVFLLQAAGQAHGAAQVGVSVRQRQSRDPRAGEPQPPQSHAVTWPHSLAGGLPEELLVGVLEGVQEAPPHGLLHTGHVSCHGAGWTRGSGPHPSVFEPGPSTARLRPPRTVPPAPVAAGP